MIHEMDIWHESFVKIKEQTKTIEMRLFDEKRSLISIGDTIIFACIMKNHIILSSVNSKVSVPYKLRFIFPILT